MIRGGSVSRKLRLEMPVRIYDMEALICSNKACIAHPINQESVLPSFRRAGNRYQCEFCDAEYEFTEIWR